MKILCVLLLAGSYACLGQRITRVSDPRMPAIGRLCLAPTQAQLLRVGMKGRESLSRESEEWTVKLRDMFWRAIEDAGGQPAGDLSAEPPARDEVRESVTRIRQKYDSIWPQIKKKRGGVKKGRYTLGDEVLILPCARDADSVAFINAEGLLQTGGRKTLSILTGGVAGAVLSLSRYRVWISFVDARSGDVKSLLTITGLGEKIGEDPAIALRARLVSEFKRMHIGAAPASMETAAK